MNHFNGGFTAKSIHAKKINGEKNVYKCMRATYKQWQFYAKYERYPFHQNQHIY